MWLTKENVNKIDNFTSFSALCFFDINVQYSVNTDGKMIGIMNEFMIAYSIHNVQPVMNYNYFLSFFEKLRNARYTEQDSYLSSDEFGESLIYSNFALLKEATKTFCVESVPAEELMALKMTLILSVVLKNQDHINCIRSSSARKTHFCRSKINRF